MLPNLIKKSIKKYHADKNPTANARSHQNILNFLQKYPEREQEVVAFSNTVYERGKNKGRKKGDGNVFGVRVPRNKEVEAKIARISFEEGAKVPGSNIRKVSK